MPDAPKNMTALGIHQQVTSLLNAIPTVENPTARDWAGFFQALASFAAAILPLILPLFAGTNPPTS